MVIFLSWSLTGLVVDFVDIVVVVSHPTHLKHPFDSCCMRPRAPCGAHCWSHWDLKRQINKTNEINGQWCTWHCQFGDQSVKVEKVKALLIEQLSQYLMCKFKTQEALVIKFHSTGIPEWCRSWRTMFLGQGDLRALASRLQKSCGVYQAGIPKDIKWWHHLTGRKNRRLKIWETKGIIFPEAKVNMGF